MGGLELAAPEHFIAFKNFLYELVAQGGVRARVGSFALLAVFDRQQGDDPYLQTAIPA